MKRKTYIRVYLGTYPAYKRTDIWGNTEAIEIILPGLLCKRKMIVLVWLRSSKLFSVIHVSTYLCFGINQLS